VTEVVERNIEDDPELHHRYLERIPVVELGDQRVELIVTVGKLRRLFSAAFDSETPGDPGPALQSPGATT
jgi:hypothetical protein